MRYGVCSLRDAIRVGVSGKIVDGEIFARYESPRPHGGRQIVDADFHRGLQLRFSKEGALAILQTKNVEWAGVLPTGVVGAGGTPTPKSV